jgi:two-component system sensor histidine kinase KdpD
LGLAICRAILQAHGGTISASNLSQGGASFRIWLPVGQLPQDIEQASQASEAAT